MQPMLPGIRSDVLRRQSQAKRAYADFENYREAVA
jgi:hypothetical protein